MKLEALMIKAIRELKGVNMNKFEEAEALAEELECEYELAYDLVYGISGDPEETDDAL